MHICRHTYWGLHVWECRKTGSFSSLQACCSHFGQTVLVSEISWHQCRDADFGSWLWCTFLKETFSMYYHFSPLMCAWVPSNSNGPPKHVRRVRLTGPFAVGSLVYLLGQTTRKRTTTYGFKGRRHICRGNLACTQVTVWLERGGKSTRTFFVQSPGNLFAD
jgi:hypothetical protein